MRQRERGTHGYRPYREQVGPHHPESYILLHGPKGGPGGAEEAFKLALVELAA